MNFGFVDGIYNSSSISLDGLDSASVPIREIAVVGGTGVFRFARVYAIAKTYSFDHTTGDAIVRFHILFLSLAPSLFDPFFHLVEFMDKFVIGDDFDNDEQAQEILDRKAYLLYKDWRYNLKQEFLELEEKGVDDAYSHPPSGVSLEDWKYLIDVAWKDESHLKRSKAGKANRGMLPYNHTSGSRSFPIAMSLMANEDGDIDFPEFYKKSHKSKETGDWIDPKCGELHDDMMNLQVVATDAGLPLTREELSRQVLGAKKNYLRGCGIGPQPSSTTSSAARARDKHMEAMRAELEVLREYRQRDHEELLKEKEEQQRDHEELLKEKEERQRDREDIMREERS
ncbi:hypothetical protein ACSBR1_020133 [Camellia fascicularis]